MNVPLIQKVLEKHQLHEAAHVLSTQLNTSELSTFLTYVVSQRIEEISPAQLRHAFQQDRFVTPSSCSPRVFHVFDEHAFKLLPDAFELMELSPLAPLGTVSAIAAVDHGLVMHTIRSQDVISDSTNVLALIATDRRYHLPGKERTNIHLAASQRLVRAQSPQHKNHTAHFKILTLVSAGRASGAYSFEQNSLDTHLTYYVSLIRSFDALRAQEIQIVIKEYAETRIDWGACLKVLSLPGVTFDLQILKRENWNYYFPFQFNLNIPTAQGIINLADGGMTDWTQQLLSDKKERLLISGFGTELFCKLYM